MRLVQDASQTAVGEPLQTAEGLREGKGGRGRERWDFLKTGGVGAGDYFRDETTPGGEAVQGEGGPTG